MAWLRGRREDEIAAEWRRGRSLSVRDILSLNKPVERLLDQGQWMSGHAEGIKLKHFQRIMHGWSVPLRVLFMLFYWLFLQEHERALLKFVASENLVLVNFAHRSIEFASNKVIFSPILSWELQQGEGYPVRWITPCLQYFIASFSNFPGPRRWIMSCYLDSWQLIKLVNETMNFF
jgi:hypothetical protein